ncbi:MAG: hypothetical protein E6G49_12395 [Actinobacteria bacterium]|nr:MAG: hypothetical protein E6G49_12395 [Actinomycetota bacterium]
MNGAGKLGTAPQPTAPLRSQSKTLDRLRDNLREQRAENRRQRAELRQQGAAIQRLREQMQNGG